MVVKGEACFVSMKLSMKSTDTTSKDTCTYRVEEDDDY